MGLSTACLAICEACRHTTFENGLNQRFSSEPKSSIHNIWLFSELNINTE